MFFRQKNKAKVEEKVHYVVFSLGDEEYGIPIQKIQEVIQVGEISTVPNSADFVAGVMDMRGKIITMIDLARKFNIRSARSLNLEEDDRERQARRARRRAVVVNLKGNPLGLIVDRVSKVQQFGSDIDQPPPTVNGIRGSNIIGIGRKEDRFIILLDIEKILSEDDFQALNHAMDQQKKHTSRDE